MIDYRKSSQTFYPLPQYTATCDPASIMNTENLPDYLTIPGKTIPSFHCRVGRDHNDRQPQPANTYGFPVPGVQGPSAASVMALDYFARYEFTINTSILQYLFHSSNLDFSQ